MTFTRRCERPQHRVQLLLCRLMPLLILSGNSFLLGDRRMRGPTAGELIRSVGLVTTVIAIILLLVVEFLYRRKVESRSHHWLLLIGLFILPTVSIIATCATVFEETKTVSSCASCHVMHPFVRDLKNASSPTLAARHFRNKWIADHQCYSCHTTYGVHGTLSAKRDGFRHWLLYVTRTWKEPIKYRGSYPNSNCLGCHEKTPKFDRVESHQALMTDLLADGIGCATCHGPVHPSPEEPKIPAWKSDE